MKRAILFLVGGVLISAFVCASGFAQATAQISGTVKDQSGAVLPGAEITATQIETGVARSAISNETGSYVLANLATGPYRLEASLPGFRTYVQTGIVLQVNANPVINAVLQVGQVSEQVEVQANAALVETRSTGVGQVIENERILELPLNGRQATDLIMLAGAAVQTGVSNTRAMQNVPSISVAGGFSSGTVFLLDGAMHNDVYNNLNLPLPFPDALQEFKVETSALSAQYGMYSGASISSVTKSGTNELHGDLFEFVRNDLFNARNPFALKNSTLKRNQFGGTLGGPIKKNKVFFFGGFQGTTLRADPADLQSYVPTAAMLAGDFTAITSPACRSAGQLTLRAPFLNNRVDPSSFSPAALNLTAKLPKTSDPCGLIRWGQRTVTDEKQFVAKVDFQLSDKHSVFGRYLANPFAQPVPYATDPNLLNTVTPGFDNLAQSYAFGDTYLMSPNAVNTFRLAVNRTAIHRVPANYFSARDVGVNIYSYTPTYMLVTVTGGFQIGQGVSSEQTNRTTAYSASEDVSLVRGTHQWAFGGSSAHWRSNFNANVYSPGPFTFSGQTTGLGLADFLIGKPNTFLQSFPNTEYFSEWYFGLYATDTWKATPRLTVNYGLRWEPYFPQVIRNGAIYQFDEARYAAGAKSTVFANAPAGMSYPGDPGFAGKTGMPRKWWDLMPRLGLAWDPHGNGRMSIRASYGLAYDMLADQFHTGTTIAPPWGSQINLTSPAGGFDNPWQGYPGGNPFPLQLGSNAIFVPYGSYTPVPSDYHMTSRNSWNLTVQKQLATDWLVSTSYIGSQASHVWVLKALNPGIYIPGGSCTLGGVVSNPCSTTSNTNARRRLALQYPSISGTPFGFLDQFESSGTQSYEGLLLSVQRRASRGVTVSGNYTWSHCWGDANRAAANPNAGTGIVDPNNRRFDRGNCDGDRRQIFNMTAVADMPRFAGAALRTVATGWRLSGIFRKSTGSFLSVITGSDRAFTGIGSQRAQQIMGNPYGDKSINNYLNPGAFTLPDLGSNGNMSPFSIQGPGTWQLDTALSRTFQIRESQKLEVRAEAFNVTNGFRPLNPSTNLASNIFGKITSSYDPRIMQFALKYIF